MGSGIINMAFDVSDWSWAQTFVQCEIVEVLSAESAIFIRREVGGSTSGVDKEVDFISAGVDGIAQVDGFRPLSVVECSIKNVASAHAGVAVGDEIECATIGMDEGRGFVVFRIDGFTQIDGNRENTLFRHFSFPDVHAAESAGAIGNEVDGFSVWSDGRL